jgi:hypothetical protein
MKRIILFIVVLATLMGCGKPSAEVANEPSVTTRYSKTDLKKISWIEGNWKGMDGDDAFYEIYRLANDSTLEITSYSWNGSDSSKTSRAYLRWNKDAYYLGDSLNWKVTAITDESISMDPNFKAYNTILWKKNNDGSWDAVLNSKRGEKVYKMEKVDHFK